MFRSYYGQIAYNKSIQPSNDYKPETNENTTFYDELWANYSNQNIKHEGGDDSDNSQ